MSEFLPGDRVKVSVEPGAFWYARQFYQQVGTVLAWDDPKFDALKTYKIMDTGKWEAETYPVRFDGFEDGDDINAFKPEYLERVFVPGDRVRVVGTPGIVHSGFHGQVGTVLSWDDPRAINFDAFQHFEKQQGAAVVVAFDITPEARVHYNGDTGNLNGVFVRDLEFYRPEPVLAKAVLIAQLAGLLESRAKQVEQVESESETLKCFGGCGKLFIPFQVLGLLTSNLQPKRRTFSGLGIAPRIYAGTIGQGYKKPVCEECWKKSEIRARFNERRC